MTYAPMARGLVKRYGDTTALAGIDLDVPTGTVTALLGPNAPEGVTGVAFGVLFPVTFLASTFVPTSTMPRGVRTIAEWNPVTALSDAVRAQFGNPKLPRPRGDPWSIAHPMAYSWIWIVGIVVVCAPLAVRSYERTIAE